MSRTWLTTCTRAPGPENNLNRYPASYGVPSGHNPYGNKVLGVVNHSAGGYFTYVDPASVMRSRGNSWHITIYRDGRRVQHFPLEAMCWGAGPLSNWQHVQIEHEGGPPNNPSEPLTTLQLASTIEVQSELCRLRRWPCIKRGVTGFEHNKYMYTDCPSDRIPWLVLETNTKEGAMPPSFKVNYPVVGMATTPKGDGYWLVTADGGVFNFGKAGFYGSAGDLRLTKPIDGIVAMPNGKGYWLYASDGGIFSYGDAKYHGRVVAP